MKVDLSTGSWSKLGAPRRDPGALGFGVAFVVLGVVGVFRSAGISIDASLLAQIALVALGGAGVYMLVMSNRRRA